MKKSVFLKKKQTLFHFSLSFCPSPKRNRVFTSLFKFLLSLHFIYVFISNRVTKRGTWLHLGMYILYTYICYNQREGEKKRDACIHRSDLDGCSGAEMKYPFRRRTVHGTNGTFAHSSLDRGTWSKSLVILSSQARHEGSVIWPQGRWSGWSAFRKEFC